MANYLRRIEALDTHWGIGACRGSCVKCALARLHCETEGLPTVGCDGAPMTLTQLLKGINGELPAPAR